MGRTPLAAGPDRTHIFGAMRILLVDDHRPFRESFRIAIWREASICVVGEAGSAREVYPLVEAEKRDLVVTDMRLVDTDGVSVARELTRRGQSTRIMILTMHTNAMFVSDA